MMRTRHCLWLFVLLLSNILSLRAQTAAPWQTGAYVYDGAGNIKAIGTTEQYRYDALGRLRTGTIATGQTQSATYDSWGNIKSLTTAGTSLTIGVDRATNRAVWSVDPDTGVPYNIYATYDNAGRLTLALNGAGGTFSYDATDTVMKSTVDGITRVHLYTASDERIASVTLSGGVEAVSEWTLRDLAGRVLRRLQKNGSQWALKEDYVYAGVQMLAAEVDASVQTLHFFPDHLGSPRLITGNGGTKIAFHTYYPFGAEATSPLQNAERLKFTGHERDAESLDYMHARYYGPKWGRFLSPDPADSANPASPQTWNPYSYVENNPINRIDPTGRQSAGFVAYTIHKSDEEAYKRGQITRAEMMRRSQARVQVALATVGSLFGGTFVGRVLQYFSTGQTITRYMSDGEAAVARRTGNIPNTNAQGQGRPTHVTTDPPLNSSQEAQSKYELPVTPTQRATVPANRAPNLEPAPGGPTTSGGGSQAVTNELIPVKPSEIKPLDQSLWQRIWNFLIPK